MVSRLHSYEGYESVPVGQLDEDVIDRSKFFNVTYPDAPGCAVIPSGTSMIYLSDFHDGVAYVYDYDLGAYYIDEKGNKLFDAGVKISAKDKMPRFCDDVVAEVPEVINLKQVDGVKIRNKKGELVKVIKASYMSQFVDGVAIVELNGGTLLNPTSKVYYVNTKGEPVLPNLGFSNKDQNNFGPAINSYISPVTEGMRRFSKATRDKSGNMLFGVADESGKIIVEPKYAAIGPFSEGLAAVKVTMDSNGEALNQPKWGFIDKTGREVIAPKYSIMPSAFNSGYAVITDSSYNNYYIDKTGKIVFGPDQCPGLRYLSPFCNGYASMVQGFEGRGVVSSVIDTNFNKVSGGCGDFKGIAVGEDFYFNNDMFGLIYANPSDMSMKIFGNLPAVFVNGYAKFQQNGGFNGFMNKDGEIVIKFEKDKF